MLNKLRKMRTLDDEEDDAEVKPGSSGGQSQQPAWMRSLLSNCNEWLASLPSVSIVY
jgi:dynein heavy chain 1